MNLSAIILAAGDGTRMKSNFPKVMHKVASKPLIWYLLNTLEKIGVEDSAVVVGSHAKQIEDYLHIDFGLAHTVHQEKRLGTGHAVINGLEGIRNQNNNIMVLYGDTPFIHPETIRKMNSLVSDDVAVVVLGFVAKDPARYGRMVVNEHGELEKIVEYLDAINEERKINLCNSGLMLINGKHLGLLSKIDNKNAKGEYYLTDLVQIARNNNLRVKHFAVDETEVLGVNSRKDLAYAEEVIQASLRKSLLESGVSLVSPNTVTLAADTVVGNDCVIHPHVVFESGVILHSNVEVKSFSHIEGAEIKSGATIGPFARIRPGSNLDEDTKVGNFVEIKNSDIKRGSKVNHLAYVGDSKLGSEVNIGAGTITCNYDGYNKSQTIIGDKVFVGSNCSLVAPVEIGEAAIIGAGSVITKNIPKDSLAVARGEEKIYAGKAVSIRKSSEAKYKKYNKDNKRL